MFGYGFSASGFTDPGLAPGLLDFYPATAAYSLRKLRHDYTGAAIRVRRDSDNAEQDIGFSGLDLDTAALTSFCTGTNGFVVTWYDQQGSNNATQATAASQPKIYDSSTGMVMQNSKPAIDFDDDFLSVPSSTGNFNYLHDGTSSSVFITATAGKIANPNTAYTLLANQLGSVTIGISLLYDDRSAFSRNNAYGVSVVTGVGGATAIDSITNDKILPTQQSLISSFIDADNSTASNRVKSAINGDVLFGSNIRTTAPSTANATYDFHIGSLSSILNLVGFYQELIIYNTDQLANRTAIESNINDYYNIYP